MSFNNIEVVLARIHWKKNSKKNYSVEKIVEIDSAKYSDSVRLGSWKSDGELLFQPYVKAEIDEDYPALNKDEELQIDIVIKAPKDLPGNYIVTFTNNEGEYSEKDQFVRFDSEESSYSYFVPSFKKAQINYYVTIGHTNIMVIDSNTSYSEKMSLISKDPGLYKNFVQDLFAVYQKFISPTDKAYRNISIGTDKCECLQKTIEKEVEEFYELFCRIENKSKSELIQKRSRQQIGKVKKITSRAILENKLLGYEKVNSVLYEESLDTFEHRVIKTYLKKLISVVDYAKDYESDILDSEEESLEEIQDSIKKLEDEISGIEANKNRKLDEVLKPEWNLNNNRTDGEKISVGLRMKKDKDRTCFSYIKKDDKLKLRSEKGFSNAYRKQYRLDGEEQAREYKYENNEKTQFIDVGADFSDFSTVAFLYYIFDSSEKSFPSDSICDVVIEGRVKSGYASTQNSTKNGETITYSKFNFSFIKIEAITIAGNRYVYNSAENDHYIELFKEFLSDDLSNDERTREQKAKRDLKSFNNRLKMILIKNDSHRWNMVENMLKHMDESELMKAVSDVKTPLMTSNIFSFDSLYNRIFMLMRKENNMISVINSYGSDNEYDIDSLPNIYERWCFIKMVYLFADTYDFRIQKVTLDEKTKEFSKEEKNSARRNLADIIYKSLCKGRKSDSISGTVVTLAGSPYLRNDDEESMTVNVIFDKEIRIQKSDSDDEIIRRPDLMLEVIYKDDKKIFAFDSKLRGDDYDGIEDLCDVAFKKYIRDLSHGENKPSGSFILHTSLNTQEYNKSIPIDANNPSTEVELEYNPSLYLGQMPDYWADDWIEAMKLLGVKDWTEPQGLLSQSLRDWTRWIHGDKDNTGNDNKIGSITFLPQKDQLHLIIQMIMEKYYQLELARCWLCGEKLEIQEKFTASGYPKYYVSCENCGQFFVRTHCMNTNKDVHANRDYRLFKRDNNYFLKYKNDNNNDYIVCPVCREMRSSEEKHE